MCIDRRDGVDGVFDGLINGEFAEYANDKLVMKWNAEWDRGNAEDCSNPPYDAWDTNHWNGKCKGGSGEVGSVKIIWVGHDLETSEYWREGGYAIWGQFESIHEHYNWGEGNVWFAHAQPSGLGGITN